MNPTASELCECHKNVRGDGNWLILIFMPITRIDTRQNIINFPSIYLNVKSPRSPCDRRAWDRGNRGIDCLDFALEWSTVSSPHTILLFIALTLFDIPSCLAPLLI